MCCELPLAIPPVLSIISTEQGGKFCIIPRRWAVRWICCAVEMWRISVVDEELFSVSIYLSRHWDHMEWERQWNFTHLSKDATGIFVTRFAFVRAASSAGAGAAHQPRAAVGSSAMTAPSWVHRMHCVYLIRLVSSDLRRVSACMHACSQIVSQPASQPSSHLPCPLPLDDRIPVHSMRISQRGASRLTTTISCAWIQHSEHSTAR